MKKTYTKKYLPAIRATLKSYDRLINDTKRALPKWLKSYGTACRFCRIALAEGHSPFRHVDIIREQLCKKNCPLHPCMNKNRSNLLVAISSRDIELIKRRAKIRRKWLISKLERAGFDV